MTEEQKRQLADVGLLILRVGFSGMLIMRHGVTKLLEYSEKAPSFPDPLHVGHTTSMTLAIVGEFFAPILVMLGFGTRLAAVPTAITMAVAALIIHADDPLAKKELAILYLVPYLTLIFAGGGRFSVDQLITDNKRKS